MLCYIQLNKCSKRIRLENIRLFVAIICIHRVRRMENVFKDSNIFSFLSIGSHALLSVFLFYFIFLIKVKKLYEKEKEQLVLVSMRASTCPTHFCSMYSLRSPFSLKRSPWPKVNLHILIFSGMEHKDWMLWGEAAHEQCNFVISDCSV